MTELAHALASFACKAVLWTLFVCGTTLFIAAMCHQLSLQVAL